MPAIGVEEDPVLPEAFGGRGFRPLLDEPVLTGVAGLLSRDREASSRTGRSRLRDGDRSSCDLDLFSSGSPRRIDGGGPSSRDREARERHEQWITRPRRVSSSQRF